MAISRRDILKLGVSYGTGVINFNNDSIVYDRALRKLPEDNLLSIFLSEITKAEENMAALLNEPVEAENETKKVCADDCANNSCGEQTPPSPAQPSPAKDEAPEEIEENADTTPPASEQPRENPLNDAIAAAENFRELCSKYALSSLYVQMSAIIETMRSTCLPAVEEIASIKSDYTAILDYVQHH